MDIVNMDGKKSFTFTWAIENFTFCWHKKGERISSPAFVVDTMWKTKWKLLLYPKGCNTEEDFISFQLERLEDSKGPDSFEIFLELSFLAVDGSTLKSKGIFLHSFLRGDIFANNEFVKCDELFQVKRNDFLPRDVLTARCRIWNNITSVAKDGHCFARTRIGVETWSFIWNIKLFSSFQTSMSQINSSSEGNSIITLKLFPSSRQANETLIHLEIRSDDESIKFITFRIHLVDTSGKKKECLGDKFTFHNDIKATLFTLSVSKEHLIENKDLFLPNDALKLYCECAFTTGIVLQEIEKLSYECHSLMQEENSASDDIEFASLESIKILKANLKSSYKDNLLCDTKLKTKTGTFPAHKYILSARSPVFKAMFVNDMKERNCGYVCIEDLTEDTVHRMLLYIYTASVKDLNWESASQLYAAADKYEILSLKNICSSFLRDNLSSNNACELLILSDMHQDHDLKSDVQEFILKHRSNIINLNGWNLVETNPKLASDTLSLKHESTTS